MTVVAQAFGLASNMTDVVAGTYLYELPPATTKKFVSEMTHAYRDGVALEKSNITSAPAAYGYIRGYLDLCLPATIEGRLVDHIGSAVAVADPGVTGANLEIRLASFPRAFERPKDSRTPFRSSGPPQPTPRENLVSSARWKDIQRTLCVKSTDGKLGTDTRIAIKEFYRGRGEDRQDVLKPGGVNDTDIRILADAVEKGTCEERGIKTAIEVGQGSREK